MRKILAIVWLSGVLVATGLVTNSAQATAYPTTDFYVSGSDSVVHGRLTWYDRSVNLVGFIINPSGCSLAVYTTETSSGESLDSAASSVCNGSLGHWRTLGANVDGGAHHFWIDLWVNGSPVNYAYCTRDGCSSGLLPDSGARQRERATHR